MLLVDTSVWIDHFRKPIALLEAALGRREVLAHPFVVGELALGNLPKMDRIAADLLDLPQALIASADEVLHLILREKISGSGIGYVDVHLLASARLTPAARFWTHDKRLHAVAVRLSILRENLERV